jgi:hypothetical protein
VVLQVVQTTFVEFAAQVVMILRVYALAQNKTLIYVLSAHAAAQFGLGLFLCLVSHHGLDFSASGSLLSQFTMYLLQRWSSQRSPSRCSIVSELLL